MTQTPLYLLCAGIAARHREGERGPVTIRASALAEALAQGPGWHSRSRVEAMVEVVCVALRDHGVYASPADPCYLRVPGNGGGIAGAITFVDPPTGEVTK